MPPPVSFAKTELGFPIFAAEFDPYNRGYLLVGGGGGENKAGIANKITLIDTRDRSSLAQVAEVDLSRQEDSVSSLASLATKDGLIAFTGIGSSIEDKKNGKNEHFRTFSIKYPPRAKQNEKQKQGDIAYQSKTCLFRPVNATDRQTYQALIKLSPIKDRTSPTKRLGVIATGLAPSGEIAVFDATSPKPTDKSVCARITLDKGVEPHDLDIFDLGDSRFAIAYCTDEGAYVYRLTYDFERRKAKCDESPTSLYKIPKSSTGKGIAPPPRLKWLSSSLLMLLVNKNPGVELVILRVQEDQAAQVARRKPLSKAIKSAVSLAVCPLDPDPATKEQQIVLAIASGVSIHIFTLNHRPEYLEAKKQISDLAHFTSLGNVHPVSITRAVFSNFFPPMQPVGSNMSVASTPQYIQLASVTLSGSIVAESLALTSTPTHPSDTAIADQSDINDKKTHHPNVRWVLSTPTAELLRKWSAMGIIAAMVLATAVVLRSYLDLSRQENVVADSWMRLFGSEPPYLLPRPEGGQQSPGLQHAGDNKIVLSADDGSGTYRDSVEYAESLLEKTGVPTKVAGEKIRSLMDSAAEASSAAAEAASNAGYTVLVHPHDDHDDEHPEGETSLGASTHHDAASVAELRSQGARRFDELLPADQERWRRRLQRAGQWSRDEGESVLKGILFSEYAGVVGGALRDAVLG